MYRKRERPSRARELDRARPVSALVGLAQGALQGFNLLRARLVILGQPQANLLRRLVIVLGKGAHLLGLIAAVDEFFEQVERGVSWRHPVRISKAIQILIKF